MVSVIEKAQSQGILSEKNCNDLNVLVEKYSRQSRFNARFSVFSKEFVREIRLHKRLAICALVALLLAGFFGLTPTGRAIAEDIRRVIISLFEDGYSIDVKPEDNTDNSSNIIVHDVIEYSTIEDFEASTGLRAAYVDNHMFNVSKVTQYKYLSEIMLCTIYQTIDGGTIEVQQTWHEASTYYFGSKNEGIVWAEYLSASNIKFAYFINSTDVYFSAITSTPDAEIYITGDVPQHAILFLDSLQIPRS